MYQGPLRLWAPSFHTLAYFTYSILTCQAHWRETKRTDEWVIYSFLLVLLELFILVKSLGLGSDNQTCRLWVSLASSGQHLQSQTWEGRNGVIVAVLKNAWSICLLDTRILCMFSVQTHCKIWRYKKTSSRCTILQESTIYKGYNQLIGTISVIGIRPGWERVTVIPA